MSVLRWITCGLGSLAGFHIMPGQFSHFEVERTSMGSEVLFENEETVVPLAAAYLYNTTCYHQGTSLIVKDKVIRQLFFLIPPPLQYPQILQIKCHFSVDYSNSLHSSE